MKMMMNTAAVPTLSTKRVLIGVALSMLAHVVLLAVWRSAPEPVLAPPPAAIVLHLQAPAPVVAAVPAPPPLPATRSKPAATPRTPKRVIAVAQEPSAATEPAVVVAPQPAEAPPPPPQVKKFDLEAARSTARIVGVQDAPNADDAPLARLKKREEEAHIQTESKAARAISAAKRGDCKDGLPGGLLAPLIMLTQKAGTGCKW